MVNALGTVAAASGALLLYLWHVERGQSYDAPEAREVAPKRWTEAEMRECYERICKSPIEFGPSLPPKLERRYIIVGGSGLVGGFIILHLLKRGQSPQSIRNVDFRPPVREDMKQGEAARIGFKQADITKPESVQAAFDAPWDPSVAKLPLTVIHTAAVIIPQDRFKSLLPKVMGVNVQGTKNVIASAKRAGCDVFIGTSSGSIALRRPEIWIPPWRTRPRNYFQIYPDPDKDQSIRAHDDYFGNYAASKAQAEQVTLQANAPGFRTGCIRPACGVYGNQGDLTVAVYLRQKSLPSWVPHLIQTFVHAENVSLAHLQLEAALLSPHTAKVSGKAFTVTDPGRPYTFGDVYNLLSTLSDFSWQHVPAVPLLLLAYAIEAYTFARHFAPILCRVTPAVPAILTQLQPSVFFISAPHQIARNDQAMLPPAEGGIGYTPACTTMEGMCQEIKEWNDLLRKQGVKLPNDRRGESEGMGVVEEVVKAAEVVPAAATE